MNGGFYDGGLTYAHKDTHRGLGSICTSVGFTWIPSGQHAVSNISLTHTHTHVHFVLPPASQEFCLPAWCLVPAGSSSWQLRPLCSWMDRVDVWVIKSACGAQHAANTLPVSVPVCVCSLTERAQLLKNVFKKSTVSLYRSDSMQQNLLRKLHHISSSLFLFLLPFLPNMPREGVAIPPPKDQSVAVFDLTASKSVPGTHRVSLFLLWHVRYLCNLQSVWPLVSNRPLFINTPRWPNAGKHTSVTVSASSHAASPRLNLQCMYYIYPTNCLYELLY